MLWRGDSHHSGELQSLAALPPALLSVDNPVSHPGHEIHTPAEVV